MDKGIHFISGLPRSGSTLLSALLRQNPKFSANVNSPVYPLFATLQTGLSGRSEFHSFFDERKRRAILRGLFDSYYEDVRRERLVFDTNRGWCSKLAALDRVFPDAKVICCVRPIAQIIDSIERIIQANALEPSRLFNFEGTNTVYSRAETLNATPTGLIGTAYAGLREAFFGPFSDKLVFVTYESLVRYPTETMREIYNFIGEKPATHDFENVEFDTREYDASLGLPGLHRVRKVVEYRERENALPPDIIERFKATAFWAEGTQNPRNVRVI